MTRNRWKDITILGRTTAEEIGDRVEVEWKLSATPELEWAEIFQMADVSERQGTREWVLGGGPDVLHDVVRWFVPAKQVEDADAEVRHRLAMANGRFGAERADVEDDDGGGVVVVSGHPDDRSDPDPIAEPDACLGPCAGPSTRRSTALAVLCIAVLIVNLDNTILNVALPTLVLQLHAGTEELQWIVDAYALVFGGVMLTCGSLADQHRPAEALRGRPGRLRRGLTRCGILRRASIL